MKISFEKQPGDASYAISFFWKITLETESPTVVTDHFIPELFYDYFFIKEGKIKCLDKTLKSKFDLPQQVLKSIHAHPLIFVFSTPLILYGARLSLNFAESFWEEMPMNTFLNQTWLKNNTEDLDEFARQVTNCLAMRKTRKLPCPMLSMDFGESDWLASYSPRHKRRLYKTVFGMSRKELQNIRNVHSFLEQTCNFASENPRIIHYLNPDVFYDQPHLNHIFKKMTGFSPVEYIEASSVLQDNLMSASYNEVSIP